MSNARIFTIAALVVLVIVVVLQNLVTTEVRFLLFTIQTPRAVLLTMTLLVGFVLGLLVAARRSHASKKV